MTTKSQILREDKTLAGLIETRQNILAEMSELAETEQDWVFLGAWSVEDLLADLIGWDDSNFHSVKSVLEGQLPSLYEHRDHDWQTHPQQMIEFFKKQQ
jgi:hypothetical protein